jgi:hypothetical protein
MSREAKISGEFKLGVIIGYDTLSKRDLASIKDALNTLRHPVAFITGDCRDGPGFEYQLFKSWTKHWFSPLRGKLVLRRPDYDRCALLDLVKPVTECETILSSRFHGILTAAWFGCKVAALGRGTKVTALAKECDIPCVEPPFDAEKIRETIKNACPVDRNRLREIKEMSLSGVLKCKFW